MGFPFFSRNVVFKGKKEERMGGEKWGNGKEEGARKSQMEKQKGKITPFVFQSGAVSSCQRIGQQNNKLPQVPSFPSPSQAYCAKGCVFSFRESCDGVPIAILKVEIASCPVMDGLLGTVEGL